MLIEAPSLAETHVLTVLCIPVKWKPAWNDNPGFRGGNQAAVPQRLLKGMLCLLPSELGPEAALPSLEPSCSGFLCTEGSAPGSVLGTRVGVRGWGEPMLLHVEGSCE